MSRARACPKQRERTPPARGHRSGLTNWTPPSSSFCSKCVPDVCLVNRTSNRCGGTTASLLFDAIIFVVQDGTNQDIRSSAVWRRRTTGDAINPSRRRWAGRGGVRQRPGKRWGGRPKSPATRSAREDARWEAGAGNHSSSVNYGGRGRACRRYYCTRYAAG